MQRGIKGTLAVAMTVGVLLLTMASAGPPATSAVHAEPQRRSRSRPKPKPPEMKFSHQEAGHQLACDSCHKFPSPNWNTVRTGDAAFPDVTEFPAHDSCLKCHRTQFFARERPAPRICSVCHVGVTPKLTARHPFPNPIDVFRRSSRGTDFVSGFAVSFPHDRHLELFGEGDSCLNCHTTVDPQGDGSDEYAVKPPADLGDGFWLKKGTFKTSPVSHASCFTCHAADSGMRPEPRECAVCHRLTTGAGIAVDFDPKSSAAKAALDPAVRAIWRERDVSATFRHESVLHSDIACVKCHSLTALDTTNPRSARVGIVSCGGDSGCHVTATADEGGALNFEMLQRASDPAFRCTKCHIAYATSPVPASHVAAVPGATSVKLP